MIVNYQVYYSNSKYAIYIFMIKQKTIKKFTRILYLINKLDSGTVNLLKEAQNLGFAQRTLQRDLAEIEAIGLPITSPVKGLYKFTEGFNLRKMPLSARDNALLMIMAQISKALGADWLASFNKIKNNSVRPDIENVYFIKMPIMNKSINPDILRHIEQAILKHTYLDLYYDSQTKKAWSRHLMPLKIALFEGFWYLIAWADWGGYMKFSLSRIIKTQTHKETFKPNTDLEKLLLKTPNIWFDAKQEREVKLKVEKPAACYFKEVEFFPNQKIKENKDGSILVSCKISKYMEIIPQIQRWIPYITVISPKELKQNIKASVQSWLSKI